MSHTCQDCGCETHNSLVCDSCVSSYPPGQFWLSIYAPSLPFPPPKGFVPRNNTYVCKPAQATGKTYPLYPQCRNCHIELCEALDAYYGPSALLAKLCSKCRPAYE